VLLIEYVLNFYLLIIILIKSVFFAMDRFNLTVLNFIRQFIPNVDYMFTEKEGYNSCAVCFIMFMLINCKL